MLVVGCKGDLKPGEFRKEVEDYLTDESKLALAYRHENEGFAIAVLRVESDVVDLSLVRIDKNFETVSWDEEWFYRCSYASSHLLCTANSDGPLLIGTTNHSQSLTIFGSGDPPGTTHTKEFVYEYTFQDPGVFREVDWSELQSDFDKWLNQ